MTNINLLLTEREGRTGEYWPEVVAVRTERSEVRTKTTEGQYSPVRSRASEVSKWFIIWYLKKDTGNYLSIKYCKLFASVALKRTLWMLTANFRRS